MEAACVRQWSPHWLLPQGESTDTCLAWCSLSSQGQLKSSRRSRSTSINDWCQSGLTRPCHRPVSKNQSWSRILSPSSLTLAHPSALSHPLLFFLSLRLPEHWPLPRPLPSARAVMPLTHIHTRSRANIFTATHAHARTFLFPSTFCPICHSLPQLLPLRLCVTLTHSPYGHWTTHHVNHSARCVSATQKGGNLFLKHECSLS